MSEISIINAVIKELNGLYNHLNMLPDSDNIILTDTIQEDMTKLQFKVKEQAVLKEHNGPINPIVITKRGKQVTVYKVSVKGRRYQSSTYTGIINSLAIAYGITEDTAKSKDYSIGTIFEKALNERQLSDGICNETFRKYKSDFKRFISEEFSNQDIRTVKRIDLEIYSQQLIKDKSLTEKAFKSYKSILNLIFDYATDYDHELISINPVDRMNNKKFYKGCYHKDTKDDEIFSLEEISQIKSEIFKRRNHKRYNGYFVHGYIALLAIETGMRVAELCSLKESDIISTDNLIHIHSQQLSEKVEGHREYSYANYTKDEKGCPKGGRYYPITPTIKEILELNRSDKDKLGIKSNYVFCNFDGDWVKKDAYITFLRRMLKSMGFKVTNNHAFRKSLNSNILIPRGIPAPERAALLGHSIDTNNRHYSKPRKGYTENLRDILSQDSDVVTMSHQQIIPFPVKEKSQELNEFKAFSKKITCAGDGT